MLVPVLSALGAPAFPEPAIRYDPARCLGLAGLLVLLLLFDAVLLWTSLRSQFVTWETGRSAFGWTFLCIALAYFLIWGGALLLRGTVRWVGWPVDVRAVGTTLHVMSIAAAGQVPALALSAIWKFEEPGFANVRLARKSALAVLRTVSPTAPPSADGLETLKGALASVSKDGATALFRVQRSSDRELLKQWISAADSMLAATANRPVEDLASINALPTLCAGRASLQRTH